MSSHVQFSHEGGISRIVMDDGKANVMSPALLASLHEAFDQAQEETGLVVLSSGGRHFSGGFDLKVIREGSREEKVAMLRAGAELALRIIERFGSNVVAIDRSSMMLDQARERAEWTGALGKLFTEVVENADMATFSAAS